MALEIKWTKRIKTNFDNNVDYLNKIFGENTAKSFVQKSFAIIEYLQEYPEMGSLEVTTKNIRGFLITKT